MILGFFAVKPIPPVEELEDSDEAEEPAAETMYQSIPTEDTGYLAPDSPYKHATLTTSWTKLYSQESRETSMSIPRYPPRHNGSLDIPGQTMDLHGRKMFKTTNFWLLFIPLFLSMW